MKPYKRMLAALLAVMLLAAMMPAGMAELDFALDEDALEVVVDDGDAQPDPAPPEEGLEIELRELSTYLGDESAAASDDGELLLLEAAPETATPDGTSSNGADFEIDEDVVLVRYNGPGGDVVIPDGIKGIGESAFESCDGLRSLTLPFSVTYIGDYAFCGCNNMTSVTIPDSVTSIGHNAFYCCESLTSITLPTNITSIRFLAFSGCTSLTNVTLPFGLSCIEEEVLSGCTGLTSIKIPSSVTSIENYAFAYCTGLTSVTIPSSVSSIGKGAFDDCPNLTIYGEAGSYAEQYAKQNNIPFVAGSVSPDFEIDENGVLVKYNGPGGDVVIPNGVTAIGGDAFCECTSLTSVVIPDSVTSIGFYAFSSCTSLTSIVIPDSVTYIDHAAFSACFSLTSVTLSSGLTCIEDEVFWDCESLTSVDIPSAVTRIGQHAFCNCAALSRVAIPFGVIAIEDHAFSGCTSLGRVAIPDSVTSIGSAAFAACESLTSVTLPSGITSIKACTFEDCESLTSVTIPSGVTSIAKYAFEDCESLTSITIPSSVKSIAKTAFKNCPKLTIYGEAGSYAEKNAKKHNIPFVVGSPDTPKVTAYFVIIGVKEQFYLIADDSPVPASECEFVSYRKSVAKVSKKGVVTGMKKGEVIIKITPPNGQPVAITVKVKGAPSKVTVKPKSHTMAVGESFTLKASLPDKTASALKWKSSNKKIAVVDRNGQVTAKKTGNVTITVKTFNDKKATCKVTVKKAPKKLSLDKPLLTLKAGKSYQLKAVPSKGSWSSSIKWTSSNNSVAVVDDKGVVTGVGKGKASITAEATNGVQASCKVTVKKGNSDFEIDKKGVLVKYKGSGGKVVIPGGVTGIGEDAFSGCAGLTDVIIPDSVTSIGAAAFTFCTGLTGVTIPNSVTSIGEGAFYDCHNLSSVTIPSGVTIIAGIVFYNCYSLTSVTIPSGVTGIGDCTFYNCYKLTSVTIPSGVTSIGQQAFDFCSSLTSVTIPKSVTSIGEKAFDHRHHLTIYGEAGSQAEEYAKKYGIPFVVGSADAPALTSKAPVIGVGETFSLIAADSPVAASKCKFKSKDESVVTVNKKGIVTGMKEGSATVTIESPNSQAITVTVEVNKGPSMLSLSESKITINAGDSYKLTASLPKGSKSSVIKWTSGNTKAAVVDDNGLVTGVGKGEATIRAEAYNGVNAQCKVTVKKNKKVKYRALLIGQTGFEDNIGKACEQDLKRMEEMLGKVKGPNGAKYTVIIDKEVSAGKLLGDIIKTFGVAGSNDVSLFYIATHGDFNSTDENAGNLLMHPDGILPLTAIAETLANIRGKVIVIIDACGSGAALYSTDEKQNGLTTYRRAAASFDAAVVNAFAEADPGIWVDAEGNGISEEEVVSNTGEFLNQNKFYVLTATRYLEPGHTVPDDGKDVHRFTLFLTTGVGTSGKIPADADGNDVVTLKELFQYITKQMDAPLPKKGDPNTIYYQHAQVYPKNSDYPLFRR